MKRVVEWLKRVWGWVRGLFRRRVEERVKEEIKEEVIEEVGAGMRRRRYKKRMGQWREGFMKRGIW